MKKIKYLLVLLLVLCIGMPVQAENSDKVADHADLLTDSEEEKLEKQLTEIAEEYQCDVAVLTTNTLDGKSPMDYTDDYYYAHEYGYGSEISGIMLMVSMEDRDWWMATRGEAIQIFTDYGLEQIRDLFLDDLSDGDYYEAFRTFGSTAEAFMEEARNGQPYDVQHTYDVPMSMGARAAIALGTGLAAAVIVLAALMLQLRSVGAEREAREYVRAGSFRVTRERDLFLYRTVMKTKIETESSGGGGSSTHSTSDGGSAGGIGGKF